MNENNPVDISTAEVSVFGETHAYTLKHIFIGRDENGLAIVMGISEDHTKTSQLETMLTSQEKHLEEVRTQIINSNQEA